MSKECSCEKCVAACRAHPGWPTPEEAQALIELGYGARLMLDWLEPSKSSNWKYVWILCPAAEDCEADFAKGIGGVSFFEVLAGWTKGPCTFLRDKLCEIHNSGHKPRQCREALSCRGKYVDNYAIGKLWTTDVARKLVDDWCAQYNPSLLEERQNMEDCQ